MDNPRIPLATYRFQFTRRFGFRDAPGLVPYLKRLGISDLYSSPVLKARPGSTHGYDITDPSHLNPELGTDNDFTALAAALKDNGIGLLLDTVPNHMAASLDNPWWLDVLENGRRSPYAPFFDIDWEPEDSPVNRVVLPVLASPVEDVLRNNELKLAFEEDGLHLDYKGLRLPLDIRSYVLVIANQFDYAAHADDPDFGRLCQLSEALLYLPAASQFDPATAMMEYQQRQAARVEFLTLVADSSPLRAFLDKSIALLNEREDAAASAELFDYLLSQQAYIAEFWRAAREHLNYRRFFEINDLIGVRVEEEVVFEALHDLVLRLAQEGKVTGLRIDHIDGLHDPNQYLTCLQKHLRPGETGAGFYVVAEKILAAAEPLPEEWPVYGTTGYDFLNYVNGLFVNKDGVRALKSLYARLVGSNDDFATTVYRKKKQTMLELFPGEMRALGRSLARLRGQPSDSFTAEDMTKALVEVTACLPVYRTYASTEAILARDRPYLERALERARGLASSLSPGLFDFAGRVLLQDYPPDFTDAEKEEWRRFVLRWQQFTGAITAKGVEDTALYDYNAFISFNEVGGDPGGDGMSPDEFHRRNRSRLEHWPHTMNATATHDTKRGEDVRARLNVLSELPAEWEAHLKKWLALNSPLKPEVHGGPVPEPVMEMLLYQTMVGAWPLVPGEVTAFRQRLRDYMVKAAREAKSRTSWLFPDQEYEAALAGFVDALFADPDGSDFLRDLAAFQSGIAFYGAINALGQLLLKIASPGVPDFYQGTEMWDLNLVDPDNRRPVDFARRMQALDEIARQEGQLPSLLPGLLSNWPDGRIKLFAMRQALSFRSSHSALFASGEYIPVPVSGLADEHVCCFARRAGCEWALVAVPRLVASITPPGAFPLGEVWGEGSISLPGEAPRKWRNIFTGERLESRESNGLLLSKVFAQFPVALLASTGQ